MFGLIYHVWERGRDPPGFKKDLVIGLDITPDVRIAMVNIIDLHWDCFYGTGAVKLVLSSYQSFTSNLLLIWLPLHLSAARSHTIRPLLCVQECREPDTSSVSHIATHLCSWVFWHVPALQKREKGELIE